MCDRRYDETVADHSHIKWLIDRGFHPQETQRCDDCEYRAALDNVGRPIRGKCYGCQGCNGNGRVSITKIKRTDPYYLGGGR